MKGIMRVILGIAEKYNPRSVRPINKPGPPPPPVPDRNFALNDGAAIVTWQETGGTGLSWQLTTSHIAHDKHGDDVIVVARGKPLSG